MNRKFLINYFNFQEKNCIKNYMIDAIRYVYVYKTLLTLTSNPGIT